VRFLELKCAESLVALENLDFAKIGLTFFELGAISSTLADGTLEEEAQIQKFAEHGRAACEALEIQNQMKSLAKYVVNSVAVLGAN